MVSSRASDDELLFLKQIGLRWVYAEFGAEAPFDAIKNFRERLARFGLKIHCGIHDAYRSVKIQLGHPGRDQDIETFRPSFGISDASACTARRSISTRAIPIPRP